ncbi:WD40 repeat domain-containing protein [Roseomonas stagni]|uniref:WD40 repeat domain-containing protein n=1 Tax=Falsiroseomonas algicola TaxID=2716930 RepID=A0A6M1LES5_9PROT|nr:WD40 repeat domain-containing protein [Falsiroseomonas algicola]NGM18484.1 WD40 repeat domain-containing protein [Falsiroseomonas algicola]
MLRLTALMTTGALARRSLIASALPAIASCATGTGLGWRRIGSFQPSDPDRPPSRGFLTGSLVQSVAWHPDGQRIAVGAVSLRPFHIFNLATGEVIRIPRSQTTTNAAAFTRDGRYVAVTLHRRSPSGPIDYGFTVCDAETGAELHVIREGLRPGLTGGAQAFSLSPDGHFLAVLFSRDRITVYDTVTWSVVSAFDTPGFGGVNLAFSPDGTVMALVGQRYRVLDPRERFPLVLWDWRAGREIRSIGGLGQFVLSRPAWRPGTTTIAVGTGSLLANMPDGITPAPRGTPIARVHLVEATTGERLQSWVWPDDEASAKDVSWTADGSMLAVAAGAVDGAVRLLAPGRDAVAGGIGVRGDIVHQVAFSDDGRRLAIGQGSAVAVHERLGA